MCNWSIQVSIKTYFLQSYGTSPVLIFAKVSSEQQELWTIWHTENLLVFFEWDARTAGPCTGLRLQMFWPKIANYLCGGAAAYNSMTKLDNLQRRSRLASELDKLSSNVKKIEWKRQSKKFEGD